VLEGVPPGRGGSRGGAIAEALVRACAGGDNSACGKIAAHPSELRALQRATSSPPHPRRPLHTVSRGSSTAAGEMGTKGDRQAANAVQGAQRSVAAILGDTGGKKGALWDTSANMWDGRKWQSAKVAGPVDSQWLRQCTDGNMDACSDIARSNTALHSLLRATSTPGGQPVADFMPPPQTAVPKPVYSLAKRKVAQSKGDSFFGELLKDLGLQDDYDNSGVKQVRQPAQMVPDVGIDSKGKQAVWNDGTVALGLSDDKPPREAAKVLRRGVFSAASNVAASAKQAGLGLRNLFPDAKGGAQATLNYHLG